MTPGFRQLCLLVLKLIILTLFLAPLIDSAMAIDEMFEEYNSLQGLAMGNALTADASGYASVYYNPAGLAKASNKEWEIIPIAFDGTLSLGGISRVAGSKSFGLCKLLGDLQSHPGQYAYARGNFMPAVSMRGFSASFLFDTEYAARSDGTSADVTSTQDIGPRVGFGSSFAGNLLKVGVAGKAILRDQLKGTFAHSALGSPDALDALSREGIGFGADLGMILTLPNRLLPTLGVAWRDMFNTHFVATNVLNHRASAAPDPVGQSINAATSVHPALGGRWKGTVSLEFKHIERTDLSIRKRFHVGFQADNDGSFYLWAGLNQMYLTAGMGLRVRGGNLEIGTYSQDVGGPGEFAEDRRFMMRYTVGF